MNELGFIAFPAIVAVVYLVGATLNAINNPKLDRFIPVICGFVGGVLGVVVFKTIPGYIPAENWLMALAIGVVSGFAATSPGCLTTNGFSGRIFAVLVTMPLPSPSVTRHL